MGNINIININKLILIINLIIILIINISIQLSWFNNLFQSVAFFKIHFTQIKDLPKDSRWSLQTIFLQNEQAKIDLLPPSLCDGQWKHILRFEVETIRLFLGSSFGVFG